MISREKAYLLLLLRRTISGLHAEVPCLNVFTKLNKLDRPRLEKGHEVSYVLGEWRKFSARSYTIVRLLWKMSRSFLPDCNNQLMVVRISTTNPKDGSGRGAPSDR